MAIKGKGCDDFSRLHDFKTEAVGQTDVAVPFAVQTLHGSIVPAFINPHHVKNGCDLATEIPTRLQR